MDILLLFMFCFVVCQVWWKIFNCWVKIGDGGIFGGLWMGFGMMLGGGLLIFGGIWLGGSFGLGGVIGFIGGDLGIFVGFGLVVGEFGRVGFSGLLIGVKSGDELDKIIGDMIIFLVVFCCFKFRFGDVIIRQDVGDDG